MASADTLLFSESLILSKLRSALQEFTANAFLRRDDAADIFKTAHEVVSDLIQEKTPVPSPQPLFPSFTLGGHLKFYRYLNGVWLMYVDNFYVSRS
ncbi:MAG: uncharacterized protein KVP18_000867 [Porospora cf. gigantea A]|uniref:uncharacterized protein n=1 Tax=Porospora cf. gigantea A TaxID=2853593 RepID=UPI003559F3F4|nr:MAG: hypothetical protein KVP18_000867 [Porospora cf. gigantea A]